MSTRIEVGAWRKSTRSGSGATGNCVEVGAWRKSTRSGGSGSANCVEIGVSSQGIAIRDTKHREGALLTADGPEWTSFVVGIKAGAFDA